MSETNPMPQLSLAPSAPEPELAGAPVESIQQTAAPAVEEQAPGLDESQLTEAEKKAIRLRWTPSRRRRPVPSAICWSILWQS